MIEGWTPERYKRVLAEIRAAVIAQPDRTQEQIEAELKLVSIVIFPTCASTCRSKRIPIGELECDCQPQERAIDVLTRIAQNYGVAVTE